MIGTVRYLVRTYSTVIRVRVEDRRNPMHLEFLPIHCRRSMVIKVKW
eukprot:COSAG02_NODE_2846_length_7905_cov_14.993378_2_plen_47_part_00